ncbi:MAG: hypothetical protein R6V50_06835 [Thermoplasmatota archaeon]
MGLTQNRLMSLFGENQSLLLPFVRRNLFCLVSGVGILWGGVCFPPIGITGRVRHIGLFIYIAGYLRRFETIGLLGYSYL